MRDETGERVSKDQIIKYCIHLEADAILQVLQFESNILKIIITFCLKALKGYSGKTK